MKIKILPILLFTILAAQAQEVSFKWAQLKDVKTEGLQNPIIVLPTSQGFYTYSYEKAISPMLPNKMYLTQFDAMGNDKGSQNFELPKVNGREADLKTVFESADHKKLFFISELAMNKTNSNILFVQQFDATANKVSAPVELEKLTIEKISNSGSYSTAQSADLSKIAVLLHYPNVKDGKEKIKAIVFDNSLNKVWEKEYTLEHPSERGYNEQFFVTNQGKIIVAKVEDESKKEPKISVLSISDAEVADKLISETGFYPSEYKVTSLNGDAYLAGYYTDNWKPTISMGGRKEKGVFVYNISKSQLLSKNPWTDQLQQNYSGNFVSLKLLDLYTQNNDFYLVGDVKSVKEEMDKASTSFASNFTYTTGPGVIAKVDSKGALVSNVLKYDEMKYVNRMGNLTSLYPLQYNNKLYLITNDSEAKLKGKKVAFGQDVYNKTVTFSSFSDDGNITVNPVWESGTGGKQGVTWLASTFTRKIDDNNYYVYALGNNYQAFGKMTVK